MESKSRRSGRRSIKPDHSALEEMECPMARALANEYILKEVMSYLAVKDLTECRLVNKVWSQVATRVIIPKAPTITLKCGPLGIERLKKLATILSTSWDSPCRKFGLMNFCSRFTSEGAMSSQDESLLGKFIQDVAPIVVHLDIGSAGYGLLFPNALRSGNPPTETQYSRLKSVNFFIPFRTGVVSAVENANLRYMIDVLKHSPNLDTVSAEAFWPVRPQSLSRLRPSLDFLLVHVPWKQIRHLKLHKVMNDAELKVILERGKDMKLKSFQGRMYDWTSFSDQNVDNFRNLMESQRTNLETLHLTFIVNAEDMMDAIAADQERYLNLPHMPKLKTLGLNAHTFMHGHSDYFSSLPVIPQQFPVLNSLSISGVAWSQFNQLLRSGEGEAFTQLESLNELILDLGTSTPEGELQEADARSLISKAALMFPNVTKLGVPSNRQVLQAIDIEGAWGDLQDLTLFCLSGHCIDTALTGCSILECCRISTLSTGSRALRQIGREIYRNIFSFLHQLKTLKLDTKGIWLAHSAHFSPVSCRCILLKLKNLKCLDLLEYKSHRELLSEEMLHEARAKFEVLLYKPPRDWWLLE